MPPSRIFTAGFCLAVSLSAISASAADPAAPLKDCPDCPELIVVPAGRFVMGNAGSDAANRAEGQAVEVHVDRPFAIGRFEVTRGEFRAFVTDTGFETGEGCETWSEELTRFALDRTRGWHNPGRPREQRDDYPVSCVSWTDAKAYVAWLGHHTGKSYRLPSEAEWEYAARAGAKGRFPWGENPDDACGYANLDDQSTREIYPLGVEPAHCRDGYPDLAPVGTLKANAFGLFDVIGNVAEWVEDCYTDSYVGRPRDGRAWVWIGGCTRHPQRGGSWLSSPAEARVAARRPADANERADWVGLRVARDLEPGEH